MRVRAVFLFFILLSLYADDIAAAVTDIPSVIVTPPKSIPFHDKQSIVISREQITASGVTSLSQALETLGGVQLHDMTGSGSQVLLSLRGFGANASSNTLLLINGIPITQPDLAAPNLNAIPLQEIEAIEIMAGTESVLYGDQAVGGVINIHTRAHTNRKLEFACSGGSYAQHNCFATGYYRHDPWTYFMTASNLHSDNYRHHNDYDQNQLSGKLTFAYPTGSLYFDYTIANENMQYPGALTAQQVQQNRRQASNDTDFFKDNHYFLHLQHQQHLNADWTLQTDLAQRKMVGDGVLGLPFTQDRNSYFFKPQLKGKIGIATVINGAEIQTDHYQLNSLLGFTRDDLHKYSLFTLASIPFASRYTLTIGARGAQQQTDLNDSQDTHPINRALATTLSLSTLFTSDLSGYLQRAESYRFPKADELAQTATGVNALRTQRGVAYEAGLAWNHDVYSAKVDVYQLNLQDEIAFDPLQTPQLPFWL